MALGKFETKLIELKGEIVQQLLLENETPTFSIGQNNYTKDKLENKQNYKPPRPNGHIEQSTQHQNIHSQLHMGNSPDRPKLSKSLKTETIRSYNKKLNQ